MNKKKYDETQQQIQGTGPEGNYCSLQAGRKTALESPPNTLSTEEKLK